jgi:hypothetical protein
VIEPPCFLCGGPLGGGDHVALRGFAICADCTHELGQDDSDELAAARDRRAVRTPGTGTVWCAGCGRPMPGPGSFRWVGGEPRCPGCAPLPAAPVCAACGGQAVGPLRAVHGFLVCAACLDSHPTLALAIARARHRRALVGIGNHLLGAGTGDDDE